MPRIGTRHVRCVRCRKIKVYNLFLIRIFSLSKIFKSARFILQKIHENCVPAILEHSFFLFLHVYI